MHQHRFSAVLVAAAVAILGAHSADAKASSDLIAAAMPSAKPSTTNNMMWCWNPRWPFDGIYGPQTAQGVRNFQKMHKLMVDGVAGPKTLAALGLKGRTLNQGAKGTDVMALQKALAKHQEMMTKPTPKPTPK